MSREVFEDSARASGLCHRGALQPGCQFDRLVRLRWINASHGKTSFPLDLTTNSHATDASGTLRQDNA